jgi:hypothetical protein
MSQNVGETLCPNCGSALAIQLSEFGPNPVVRNGKVHWEKKRFLSWSCSQCNDSKEVELDETEDINAAIHATAAENQRRIAEKGAEDQRRIAENQRRIKAFAAGRCPDCGKELLIESLRQKYYQSRFSIADVPSGHPAIDKLYWRCETCGKGSSLPEEFRASLEKVMSNRKRRSQYHEALWYLFLSLGMIFPFGLLKEASVLPPIAFLIFFVLSRLADYVSTQIGLHCGAIETNPSSSPTRLTGFWPQFFFWSALFGAIVFLTPYLDTALAKDLGFKVSRLLIPTANIAMLCFSLVSLSASFHNLLVAIFRTKGNESTYLIAAGGAVAVSLWLFTVLTTRR